MSDKVIIKNKGDLYEIHPKELVNSFKAESEEERDVTPPKTLKELKYIKKVRSNTFNFCFEFPNFSKEITAKLSDSSTRHLTYEISQIEQCLKPELSPESLNILKEHFIKRQQSYQQYINEKIELNNGYDCIITLPVNFYHKVYLYGTIVKQSNSNTYLSDYRFEMLSKFSNYHNLQNTRERNRIILPNIYSGNDLCLGSNRVENYGTVPEFRNILEIFKNSYFNNDLNRTHNFSSIKNSLIKNVEYIIKHKIKDENLKNAYIELIKNDHSLSDLIRLNDSFHVYKILNLFYLLDVE